MGRYVHCVWLINCYVIIVELIMCVNCHVIIVELLMWAWLINYQTGSGKTYTMGTGLDMAVLPEQQGVIPRAVHQLFSTMEQLREDAIARGDPPPQFEITAQFLEVSHIFACVKHVHVSSSFFLGELPIYHCFVHYLT